jgi:hypothetical protein
MTHIGRLAIVAMIAMAGATMAAASVTAVTHSPRVVVIVGPVGNLTDFYRSVGNDAAREASRWTNDVVKVYSPNATWPTVKRALQGASIVVYLGHGNGFPSPYRSTPYARTENGLGLNPVAGGDDSAHQYFGESFLAREVHLAPHALVVMSHLCYASGNSEPGRPDPSLVVAEQRVDNYAAGWLAAGAGAVIADTFGPPEAYIHDVFTSHASIDRVWRTAPSFHDHVLTFPSLRNPGLTVSMDPTTVGNGYNRSFVGRSGVRTDHVLAGGSGASTLPVVGQGSHAVTPSLASLGITAGAPGVTTAAADHALVVQANARLTVPLRVPRGIDLPPSLELSVRWEPISLDPPPIAVVEPSPSPSSSPTPDASPTSGSQGSPTPTATTDPSASPSPTPVPSGLSSGPTQPGPSPSAPAQPPSIGLVVAETPIAVVTPAVATVTGHKLTIPVVLPSAPGRYRLVTTIHDREGVAFDQATQALLRPLVVRVASPVSVAYAVAPQLTVTAGSSASIPVRLANDGRLPWADAPVTLTDPLLGRGAYHPAPTLVGRWVPLDAVSSAVDSLAVTSTPRLAPGNQSVVVLAFTAPSKPGAYLLLIDLVSPLHGSLAASGVPPAEVRATVLPGAAAAASEAPAP